MEQGQTESTNARRGFLLASAALLLLVLGWILTSDTHRATAAPQTGDSPDGVVATIEGEPISEADLEAAAAERLEQVDLQRLQMEAKLRQQRQQVLQSTLQQLVEDRLLELEAKARGTSREELIQQEIESKVDSEVTDEQVDAFYEERTKQGGRLPPKEQVANQIRQYLLSQRQAQARESFLDQLREKYSVEVFLQEPRLEVTGTGPTRGPDDAPVTIVEFSDFQCPYCKRLVPTIEKIEESYGDKVRLVFRQFPLSIHQNAEKAAEASLCAAEQGKFWEMHDLLFEEQQALQVPQLKEKAERLDLDTARFDECLDSGEYTDQIKADQRAGILVGVSGTPAMVINGRFLSGAQPYEMVAKVIDEELEKARDAKQ
jgi:protein-disulfide isomerase